MKLSTKNFGTIELDETKKIVFEKGIPGFRDLHNYIFVEDQEEDSIFAYLQCIEDGRVSFIITNPYVFDKNYFVNIKEEYVAQLGGGTSEDYSILSIVTIADTFETATINFVAPLIINNETKKGMQIILENTSYTTRHNLMDLINEREE